MVEFITCDLYLRVGYYGLGSIILHHNLASVTQYLEVEILSLVLHLLDLVDKGRVPEGGLEANDVVPASVDCGGSSNCESWLLLERNSVLLSLLLQELIKAARHRVGEFWLLPHNIHKVSLFLFLFLYRVTNILQVPFIEC